MAVEANQDRAGRRYSEFAMSDDERIRVTYIPDPEWVNEPTIRIQKRGATGRLFQGEEFPAARVLNLLESIFDVLPRK
jgi:hypothetical protein